MSTSEHKPTTQQRANYEKLLAEVHARQHECRACTERLRLAERELIHYAQSIGIHPVPDVKADGHRIGQSDLAADGQQMKQLSGRELGVFRLIGQGYTTHEIADRLQLAVSTVETYRERLKHKLDLNRGAALIRCAVLQVELEKRGGGNG